MAQSESSNSNSSIRLPNELLLHIAGYVPSPGQPALRQVNRLFRSSPIDERLFCEEPYTSEIVTYLFDQKDMLSSPRSSAYSDFSSDQGLASFKFFVPARPELRINVILDLQMLELSYVIVDTRRSIAPRIYHQLNTKQDLYNMIEENDCILILSIPEASEQNWKMVKSILENRFMMGHALIPRFHKQQQPLTHKLDSDDCYIKLLAKHLSIGLTNLLSKSYPFELLAPLKRVYTPEAVEDLKQAIATKFKVSKTTIYIKFRDNQVPMIRAWLYEWLLGLKSGDLV